MCRGPAWLILLRRLVVRTWAGPTSIARSGLQDIDALACRMHANPVYRSSGIYFPPTTDYRVLYGKCPVLIAHLSDLHIRPQGMLYQGLVDSNTMCEQAITHLNRITPRPDVVIITGDLVDEGLPQEYAMARTLLAGIKQPLLMIPGNHDDRTLMGSTFSAPFLSSTAGPWHFVADDLGPVRITGVDVTVPQEHHGDMSEAAGAWLDAALAKDPARPTLIMLHQPPFLSGIPYIDTYACRNAERLREVVQRYPAIERVVCGHIHRSMQLRFGGTVLCTAPSTTTAIGLALDPEVEEASFVEPPALLLHHWKADTGLITHWVPIGTFRGPLPFA